MMNKKRIAMIGAGVGVIAVAVFAYSISSTSLFKGDISRGGGGTGGNKWWCVPPPHPGRNGEDASVPPESKKTDRPGSTTVSRKRPGGMGGFARFDSKSKSFKIDPGISAVDVSRIVFKPTFFNWEAYLPTIKGGDKGAGRTGTKPGTDLPKIDTSKVVKNDTYVCSCDATSFKVAGFDNDFGCPQPGESLKMEGIVDKAGIKHNISVSTPPAGICEKPLKDGEKAYIWHFCGCDEKTFYEPKTNKTYNCPEQGSSAQTGDQNSQYYINILSLAEYECKEEWWCPEGYSLDWKKLNDDCTAAKTNECLGKKVNTLPANMDAICKAFLPTKAKTKCEDINECKKTMKLYKDNVPTGDAAYKGLPSVSNCMNLYGNSNSSLWN